jgi:hypothetical protein
MLLAVMASMAFSPLAPGVRSSTASRPLTTPTMHLPFSSLLAELDSSMDFMSPASASGFDGVDALTVLSFGAVAFYLIQQGEEDQALKPGHGANRKQSDKTGPAMVTLDNFGWLHADMRLPLPSLDQLENACVPIGSLDGEKPVFICGAPNPSVMGQCVQSKVGETMRSDFGHTKIYPWLMRGLLRGVAGFQQVLRPGGFRLHPKVMFALGIGHDLLLASRIGTCSAPHPYFPRAIDSHFAYRASPLTGDRM